MKLHSMQLPREVIVGEKTLELVGDICEKLDFCKSALIVTGSKTCRIAGQTTADLLNEKGLNVQSLVVSSSARKDVGTVGERISEFMPEVVLGIGGGTKIDVAKLSSAQQGVPFMSIPTTASHDGIASPLVSIKGFNKPYSVMAQAPMAIIVDTSIITQSPYRFTASGCGDIMAKFTAVRDWELAHSERSEYYGGYAASLSLMSAELVLENVDLIRPGAGEGVRVLLEALISCGVAMSIAGSSRPCSGSEHLFSHALDLIVPNSALHGEQCGVGAIMMAHLHRMDWERIRNTLRAIGAPVTAEELGIDSELITQALVWAEKIRPERYTILKRKRMDYDSAEELARTTGVID